jgi:ABC-2 type transport system permease protein
MTDVGLAMRQVRFVNRSFWRNPASAFFTFAFPLMFLVIFTSVFSGTVDGPGGQPISTRNFYVPAIIAFSIVTACYTNIAMSVTFARDEGILKRIHGTPLPTWGYLVARIVHALFVAALLVIICVLFGRLVYGTHVPVGTVLPFAAACLLGAFCFCTLGLAITGFVPNADAAPAVVNAIILPLLFLSDVFIPVPANATVINGIANVFPVKHLSQALLHSFFPPPGASAWRPGDLLVLRRGGSRGCWWRCGRSPGSPAGSLARPAPATPDRRDRLGRRRARAGFEESGGGWSCARGS